MAVSVHAIDTDRLHLRPLRADDARTLHASYADAETLRYWHQLPRASEADTEAVLENISRGAMWAICLQGSDDAVGHVGFSIGSVDPARQAPFGYFLHRDLWGQGYMTEAARAVLDYGFTVLDIAAAELWIYDGNVGSRRVAEKLGGVHQGSFWGNNLELRANRLIHVYSVAGARPLGHVALTRVTPIVVVPDVAAATEWWSSTLGFRLEWIVGEPPYSASVVSAGWLPNASVVRFLLGESSPQRLAFTVPHGIDELAGALGGTVVDQPWGMRDLEVADPWGNTLLFECAG